MVARCDLLDGVKTFRPWDLEQTWLLPPSVLDFVPPDDPAHLIRDVVRESLDLTQIYAAYTEERGYPPYHPAMMTALILYAYSQGVFSSRKIARACVQREAREREEIKARGRRPKHNADGTPSEKSQRNFTDPDSKILKSADGYVQGYNGQIAVDAEHQIIVAHALTNQQNDGEMLDAVLAQVKRNMGRQAKEVSADAGYCSEINLRRLNRRHIRGYIATGRQSHGDDTARGRLGQKPGTATYEMRLRISKAGVRSRYRLRKQIVEPVFGHIKAALGFTRFLLRGLEKVRAEWALVCIACNLRKLATAG